MKSLTRKRKDKLIERIEELKIFQSLTLYDATPAQHKEIDDEILEIEKELHRRNKIQFEKIFGKV